MSELSYKISKGLGWTCAAASGLLLIAGAGVPVAGAVLAAAVVSGVVSMTVPCFKNNLRDALKAEFRNLSQLTCRRQKEAVTFKLPLRSMLAARQYLRLNFEKDRERAPGENPVRLSSAEIVERHYNIVSKMTEDRVVETRRMWRLNPVDRDLATRYVNIRSGVVATLSR